MPEAFPLSWPDGWRRTKIRSRPRYMVTDSYAIGHLKDELRRFGASQVIISSNIATKANGELYANQAATVDDPGVAVYYSTHEFKDKVIACDQWQRVYHSSAELMTELNEAVLRARAHYGAK